MIEASSISRVKTLSPAERLELIETVWETLSPEDVAVTEEEKALIDARLEEAQENPAGQSPWSEVKKRLKRLLP